MNISIEIPTIWSISTLNVNTKAMRKKKNISQCVEWMKHFRLHKHQNRPNLLSKLVNFLCELIQKYSTKIFRCEIHFQWKFSPIQSNSPYFSPRKDLMKLLHANFDSFFIYTMIFHRNRRLKKKEECKHLFHSGTYYKWIWREKRINEMLCTIFTNSGKNNGIFLLRSIQLKRI